MSSANCCFLICIQISQEAGQVVWYSHLFQNFPEFIVIHRVKGFGIINKAEIDVFLELSCFFDDPADVGNLISGSSAFSKTRLNIWKFTVHVLLTKEALISTFFSLLISGPQKHSQLCVNWFKLSFCNLYWFSGWWWPSKRVHHQCTCTSSPGLKFQSYPCCNSAFWHWKHFFTCLSLPKQIRYHCLPTNKTPFSNLFTQ